METDFFLFKINQHSSAVKTEYVEEVFALPELILIPDAPLNIVGVLDLRGDVLPVLNLQLGQATQPRQYKLSDSVLVLKQAELRIGLIINAVQGMDEVPIDTMDPNFAGYEDWLPVENKRLLAGVIPTDEPTFILNDPKRWFNAGEIEQVISVASFLVTDIYSDRDAGVVQSADLSLNADAPYITAFSPTVSPEAQAIFRQRAESLRRSLTENTTPEDVQTLVVITLNDKLFGIDSQLVREFITISQAVPVPCCPPHIVGNTNLRGDILTVIDVGQPLNLGSATLAKAPKAIVAEVDDMTIGIVVEDIRDAMFTITPRDIQDIVDPDFLTKRSYVQGAVAYNNQTMHLLDLATLLQSDELVINEIL